MEGEAEKVVFIEKEFEWKLAWNLGWQRRSLVFGLKTKSGLACMFFQRYAMTTVGIPFPFIKIPSKQMNRDLWRIMDETKHEKPKRPSKPIKNWYDWSNFKTREVELSLKILKIDFVRLKFGFLVTKPWYELNQSYI